MADLWACTNTSLESLIEADLKVPGRRRELHPLGHDDILGESIKRLNILQRNLEMCNAFGKRARNISLRGSRQVSVAFLRYDRSGHCDWTVERQSPKSEMGLLSGRRVGFITGLGVGYNLDRRPIVDLHISKDELLGRYPSLGEKAMYCDCLAIHKLVGTGRLGKVIFILHQPRNYECWNRYLSIL